MTCEQSANDPMDAAVVAARLAEIDARFGGALTPEQREQVRGRIERTLKLGAAMRTAPLTNADEPEIVFTPYRAGA
jgi:hypothetical protein